MAFFGVEVKPGKPFTHSSNKVKGRLRISQATLGIGSATKKSLVQCNVGNKSPVLLCVLMPDKTESCHLDLEFDEAEDVVFSVIGPRSIYLTGYYVSSSRHYNMNSDTESYGEDVGNTESEQSDYCSDDDKYEDSFLDDNEPEVVPPSPVSSDGVDTKTQEDNEPMDRKGNFKRLKKRCQIIESDDPTSSDDSDDNYLLSVFKSKKTAKAVSSKAGKGADKLKASTGVETENPASKGSELKELTEAVNNEPVREANHVCNSLLLPDGVFSEEVVEKDKNDLEDTHYKVKTKDMSENMPVNDVKDQKQTLDNEIGSLNHEKPKKKRKERNKDVRTHEAESSSNKDVKAEHTEADSGNVQPDLLINDKQISITNMEIDAYPPRKASKSGPKSKKRRKELQRESGEGSYVQTEAVKGEQLQQDIVKADNNGRDVPTTAENQIPSGHKDIEVKPDVVADGRLSEKKIKKKKKKGKIQIENKHDNVATSEVRTLSNGLTIEELAKGAPDGKIAAPGKRVKVYYTAWLKENGQVFDSNIGKGPQTFRLGNQEIVEGWDVGIEGMHVGDKRRLTIPPSRGFGNQGAGENVPPDSWLVYEVELVDVRR